MTEQKLDDVDSFFLYYDDSHTPYYYHNQSGKSTYDLPKKGKIYDPATRSLIKEIGYSQTPNLPKVVEEKNSSNDSNEDSSSQSDDSDDDDSNETTKNTTKRVGLQAQKSCPNTSRPNKNTQNPELKLDFPPEVINFKEKAKDDSHSTQVKVRAFYPAPNNGEAA